MVGNNSCVGKILSKLEQRIETTPLQDKLEAIATDIGKLGMYAALLTVHVLLLRFFIERMSRRTFDLFGNDADDDENIGSLEKSSKKKKNRLNTKGGRQSIKLKAKRSG